MSFDLSPFLHGFFVLLQNKSFLPSYLMLLFFFLTALPYLLLCQILLSSGEVTVLTPAPPLTSQVTLHWSIFSQPPCPPSRKRARGRRKSYLILNLKAHPPTSEAVAV